MLSGTGACVAEPHCMALDAHNGPPRAQRCATNIVMRERTECVIARKNKDFFVKFGAFCNRSIYKTSGGALATLPPMTAAQLAYTYRHVFERHVSRDALINIASHPKTVDGVRAQREWLRKNGLEDDDGTKPLTIVEMGCMHGSLLASFHSLSSARKLLCFEPSNRYHPQLERRFAALNNASATAGGKAVGGHAMLAGGLFNGSSLAPGSVDLFLSSHVVEHLAEPCTWLASVWRALRPGGHVFTEVPLDAPTGEASKSPYFHLLYFDDASFARMMLAQGFERVQVENASLGRSPQSRGLRSLFRKPKRQEPELSVLAI